MFSTAKFISNGDKVPLWRKLVYAIGSMPYAMCNTVVGFYFSIFLLEVVIVSTVVIYFVSPDFVTMLIRA